MRVVVLGDAVVLDIEELEVIDVAGSPDELAVPGTVITMGFVVHATVVAILALPQD